ncbi:thioredoxin family protein [Salinicola peritrichatus]|uniref:thioredoxin family protein n=1 Tax=Salinicola peritrichatus TaxID=1267424 RepID=UPI000DA138CA|nr:thioredoxin domain-containing protein [Salinicola peritrichatus]
MTQRQYLDGEAFEHWRETREAPWIAIFVADWCQPCEALLSRLSGLAGEVAHGMDIGIVDVDREPALAERYGVRGMPTLILFVDGDSKATRVGALSESQLHQFCDETTRT